MSDEQLAYLENLAKEQKRPLERVIQSAIAYYIDDLEDESNEREPTVEEIRHMVEMAIEDFEAGRTRPIEELLKELKEEFGLEEL